MKTVTLLRSSSTDQGTFGQLVTEGFRCFTGELPWRSNATGLSCIPPTIPPGTYLVEWIYSPRLKRRTYRVRGVPCRDGVLLHSANLMGDKTKGFVAQLEGCISLGRGLGRINRQAALLLSKPTVRAFEILMNKEPFLLEIRDA